MEHTVSDVVHTSTSYTQLNKPAKYSGPPIFRLANELLDEIASHLAMSDQRAMVLCCTLLHDITSRQLYRHIYVFTSASGSILFHTLAHSQAGYAVHTRSLHYGSQTTYFDEEAEKAFTEAFPKLKGLVHLTLNLQYPPLLTNFLAKKSIGRNDILHPEFCVPSLPRLRSFELNGDMRLLAFCQDQTIEKLTLANAITSDEVEYLLDVLGSKGPNTTLKVLDLTFSIGVDETQVACSMYQIDAYCPSIEILSIRAVMIDALEMTRILTTEPTIFKNLREISLNQVTFLLPSFHGPYKRHLLNIQYEHLNEARILRPSFSLAVFGAVTWSRNVDSDDWKASVTRHTANDELPTSQRFSDDIGLNPLFWGVFYREPTP